MQKYVVVERKKRQVVDPKRKRVQVVRDVLIVDPVSQDIVIGHVCAMERRIGAMTEFVEMAVRKIGLELII